MILNKKIIVAFAAAMLLAAAPAVSLAGLVTTSSENLATLIANGDSIQVGDKLFSNFAYSSTGNMPASSGVNVNPFTDASGNFGLGFQGAFLDAIGGGSSTASITYTVTVLDPNLQISDAHLSGNPAVLPDAGTGTMDVTETSTAPGSLTIFDHNPGGNRLTDSLVFGSTHPSLTVTTNIVGAAGTGVATLSLIDETFSQTRVVPEPASLVLWGLGGLALFGWRGRRRH